MSATGSEWKLASDARGFIPQLIKHHGDILLSEVKAALDKQKVRSNSVQGRFSSAFIPRVLAADGDMKLSAALGAIDLAFQARGRK